jgi:SAM-dependent methyltransferase
VLQDRIFEESEGDRWFERNRQALSIFDADADLPLKLIGLYNLRPQRVLEIGAANGIRLAAIHTRTGAAVVAVEPSTQAILNGKANFPGVMFIRGSATSIPLQNGFDLIILNFVFHWIDRATLLRCIAEVDRLLEDGGLLLIGDFYPSNRLRVPYHHLHTEQVQTFKQDYAATFLASGLYHPVCLITGDHRSKNLNAEVADHERIGTWLLRKELRENYLTRT